LRYKHW